MLGRRNYLFAGSDAGGETAARLYSLIGTCRLNDIDPHLYLRYVLERIAEHPINRIDELLPWRVEGLLPSVLSQAARLEKNLRPIAGSALWLTCALLCQRFVVILTEDNA